MNLLVQALDEISSEFGANGTELDGRISDALERVARRFEALALREAKRDFARLKDGAELAMAKYPLT